MFAYPLRRAALAVTAIVGLSACTTPYGYSGVSMGVGNAGYYDPYYGGYGYGAGYGGYGYGYGYPGYNLAYAPYWGWYDNFYYPGTGYYVYDRHHRRHHWTDAQRRYWQARRDRAVATGTTSQPVVIRENWNDFRRDRQAVRIKRVEQQTNRSADVDASRQLRVERQRGERSQAVRIERQRGQQGQAVRVEHQGLERAQVERRQNVDSAGRQAVREQQRSEARAERASRSEARSERPSRGNGRGRGSGED